jgi:indolepyruvate decarboxylase
MKQESKTVIGHVLGRLKDLGITDIFGVPGDYAFPINDAICGDKNLRFIGSCNEVNTAYSADGYARVKGMGALNPTYGPGELNAIGGVAGAYAEHVPIFHLTALPSRELQRDRAFVHHTLGDGRFNLFYEMTEPAVCARTIMTPENCVAETERLIAAALYHRRPVYMAFAMDVSNQPVVGSGSPLAAPQSNPTSLESAVKAIVDAVTRAKTACVLPGILVARAGLRREATALIDASGLPFATMIMDKTTLDEAHPNYIGMYDGRLMEESVRAFVEAADCVLGLGALWSDFSSGAFTAKLDPSKTINVFHHSTRVGNVFFEDVEMKDVLVALAKRLPKRTDVKGPKPSDLGVPAGTGGDKITAEALYPRWNRFLKPDDILVAETGTSSMGLGMAKMPKGATFHNQTLWGAIAWATPAAFGAAIAAPNRRTVLVTGEGSHQLTAQEVGQFHRFGLKPIIFLLNNNGYLIERLLCKDPEIYYNDVVQWHYHLLPQALGCDGWFTVRVTTCGELDAAMSKAESCGTGAYIEVVTDKYVAPPMAMKLHESTKALYKS